MSSTYHLACHCQTHVLRLTLPPDQTLDTMGVCDCSHCLKRRIVWAMIPGKYVEVVRGVDEGLLEYRFGKKAGCHQVRCDEGGRLGLRGSRVPSAGRTSSAQSSTRTQPCLSM